MPHARTHSHGRLSLRTISPLFCCLILTLLSTATATATATKHMDRTCRAAAYTVICTKYADKGNAAHYEDGHTKACTQIRMIQHYYLLIILIGILDKQDLLEYVC